MNREHYSENVRRMRTEERRDPVDAAFYAVAALSQSQRCELELRFNECFEKCFPSTILKFIRKGAGNE